MQVNLVNSLNNTMHSVKQMQKRFYNPHSLIAICLWLTLVFNSCSKNLLAGFYKHDKNIPYQPAAVHQDDEYLKLNKDSTFMYESFMARYSGDDRPSDHYSFLGTGKYHIVKDSLILNFDQNSKAGSSAKPGIPSRFIKSPYKIEDQRLTSKMVLVIAIGEGTVKVGNLMRRFFYYK